MFQRSTPQGGREADRALVGGCGDSHRDGSDDNDHHDYEGSSHGGFGFVRLARYALPLLAGDAVLVAIERAVVAHRSEVERSAALEGRDRDATRLVMGEPLADSVRIPRVHVLAVLPQVGNRAPGSRRRRDAGNSRDR